MLYYLGTPGSAPLSRVKQVWLQESGWTERDLENLLVDNMERVIRTGQWFVILQESQRQEEAGHNGPADYAVFIEQKLAERSRWS
ncbi:MAG: hypothetical protein ACLQU1_05195 [Bryobacteraceae bacterium]